MVDQTKHVFYVGERARDDSRKIPLSGYIIDSKHAKKRVLFIQGFSARYDDYLQHFLLPLGEEFRVVTYNHRGHPGSGGRFDAKKGVDDWKEIAEKMACEYVLAQSCGASFALHLDSESIKGIYCIEPLFSAAMLPSSMRAGITALKLLSPLPVVLPGLDALLDKSDKSRLSGLGMGDILNNKPLQSFAELGRLEERAYSKPLAFTVSDKDEALGTEGRPERRVALIDRILEKYPQAKNRSELVRGLNHCLNLNKNDFAPFLKPEAGKNSDKIIEDIVNFFSV